MLNDLSLNIGKSFKHNSINPLKKYINFILHEIIYVIYAWKVCEKKQKFSVYFYGGFI